MSDDLEPRRDITETVYRELQRIASSYMRKERPGHTMRPSDLLSQAVQRLLQDDVVNKAPDRAYLIAAAAKAMRRILCEHARKKKSIKGGGKLVRTALDDVVDYLAKQNVDAEELHDALDRLSQLNPRQAQIVELRFYGGYTMEDIAELLKDSKSTVERQWQLARASLYREIAKEL